MDSPAEPAWSRRETLEVLALFLLAFGIRVAYVLGLRDNPYFDAPVLDPAFHVEWARALARGESFVEGPYFRAPLYVWFLAGILKLGGGGLLAPRLVQAALGGATTVLTYLVGRRAFDVRVARLAGVGAATYWVLVYFDGELLIPTLAVPLYLLALWLTLGLGRRATPGRPVKGRPALAGAAWGVGALARPNVLLLLPVYAAWTGRVRGPRAAGAFLLGALAPILPVTAYNTFVGGDFALVSTQAGVNLWIGNNPWADGHTPRVPGTSGDDFTATWRGAQAIAEREAGRPLRPSEVSAHFAAKARGFWAEQPRAALGLLARKVGLFLRDGEIGNNQPVRFTAFHEAPWLRWTPLRYAWLAPLGLAGLLLATRRRGTFPLTAFVVVYAAGVVAFFVCARFRVPVLPPLLVLAASALVAGLDRWRAGARGVVLAGATAVLAGVAVTLATAPDPRVAQAAGELFLGQGLDLAGHPDRAAPHLERARELDPTPVARTAWALHLEGRGESERALEELRAAIELAPRHPRVLDAFLGLLLRMDRLEELRRATERALEVAPEQPTTHYHRGAWLSRVRRGRQAVEEFLEAARLEPHGSRAQAALAGLRAAMGEPRQALEDAEEALANGAFEGARRQEEETWRLAVRLALELGDVDRARRLVAACEEGAGPDSPLARELRAALP